jgi:hypothetical protein
LTVQHTYLPWQQDTHRSFRRTSTLLHQQQAKRAQHAALQSSLRQWLPRHQLVLDEINETFTLLRDTSSMTRSRDLYFDSVLKRPIWPLHWRVKLVSSLHLDMVHGTFSRCLVLNLFKMFSNKIVWTMDSETVSRWSESIFHIVTLSVTAFLSVLSTNSPVRKYLFIASRSRLRTRLLTNRNLTHSFWGNCPWINDTGPCLVP